VMQVYILFLSSMLVLTEAQFGPAPSSWTTCQSDSQCPSFLTQTCKSGGGCGHREEGGRCITRKGLMCSLGSWFTWYDENCEYRVCADCTVDAHCQDKGELKGRCLGNSCFIGNNHHHHPNIENVEETQEDQQQHSGNDHIEEKNQNQEQDAVKRGCEVIREKAGPNEKAKYNYYLVCNRN